MSTTANFIISNKDLEAVLKGDDTNELARACPMYPMTSIGMPAAGPTFQKLAAAIGPANKDELLHELHRLYWGALWSDGNFCLNVTIGGDVQTVQVLSGHLWGMDGIGPQDPGTSPRIMLIGKHPGSEEIADCRNFVGPSGQLLEQSLQDAGALPGEHHHWYITNLVKWIDVSEKSSLPAAWIKDCLPILHQELRLFRPDYILCMGAEATKAVLGQTLSSMAGRTEELKIPIDETSADQYHTAQVMAITHPAAVLRQTDKYPEFLNGLSRFIKMIRGTSGPIPGADFDLRYLYTERALSDLVDEVLAQPGLKKISVDAEWHGPHPGETGSYLRSIQFSHKNKFGAACVLTHPGGEVAFQPGIPAAIRQLRRLLDRDDVQILGHFFSSDLPWLEHYGLKIAKRFRVPFELEDLNHGNYAGGYDTALAAHACDETAEFKLELLCGRYLNAPRWDSDLQKWKKSFCLKHKIADKALEGYGECPSEILLPYSAYDVAWTWLLAEHQTRNEGLLDLDRFGNNSWRPFHTSMLAFPAFLEMGMRGLRIDIKRIDDLTDIYMRARSELTERLRNELNWPDFNPGSAFHCREFLFGEQYSGKRDRDTGQMVRVRPEGALSLYLRPIKSTGRRPTPWARVEAEGKANKVNASCDKEVLGDLAMMQPLAALLRDAKFIRQTLQSVLRPPVENDDEEEQDEEREYEGGMATFICHDGRVRSSFLQTKETGRASSARPPLQNISARREVDYARILGSAYKYALRSIVMGNDDPSRGELTVLVSSDYSGAELLAMAAAARDETMLDHCYRAGLPEDDPNYYDLHSNTAVEAFHLACKPTKKALKQAGMLQYRHAAKTVMFGKQYRQMVESMCRKCREEGTNVTVDDCAQLAMALDQRYPRVPIYQQACADRVLNPSWVTIATGRHRRVIPTNDRQVLGELQRQLINVTIQGVVADCISKALAHLEAYPDRQRLGYGIVLQMHDAIVLEVPVRSLEEVAEKVMPECMLEKVSFKACDLDGKPYADSPDYHFLMETSVYFRWGEDLTTDDCYRLGVPLKYAAT